MKNYQPLFTWIDSQQEEMLNLLINLAEINSHSFNLSGLDSQLQNLRKVFSPLGEKIEILDLSPWHSINSKGEMVQTPLGKALLITQSPEAPIQILLVCHMDTVYPPDHPFQKTTRLEQNRLQGPGVIDAKGGLVIMAKALQAFKKFSKHQRLGWKVFINPDEEIGSPGSAEFLLKAADQSHLGLVFEPCLPDGNLIGARKGSGNFTLVVRGQSAHAGRELEKGRNAIDLIAKCVMQISSLNNTRPELTVNVGVIEGGTSVNVVPDIAIARFNVRILKEEDQDYLTKKVVELVNEMSSHLDGFSVSMNGGFTAPPKPLAGKTLKMFQQVQKCGEVLGLKLYWHPSGGVCDGNRLASVGLPNIDTMGAQGGDIHSQKEYLHIPSLAERAKLTTLLLLRWAESQPERLFHL